MSSRYGNRRYYGAPQGRTTLRKLFRRGSVLFAFVMLMVLAIVIALPLFLSILGVI
jgi:hypothetical protein